jgi:hypothetical protein
VAKPKRSRTPQPAKPAAAVLGPDADSPWWRDPILWAITVVAAVLLLVNLGGRCLWEDEAETALLGCSILQHGKPIASDSINVISQEAGREFGADHVWRWSPWVQFYLAAAGLKAFGDTTLGARLPFALIGILVIPLTYILARRVYGSVLIARFAALALTTSVWFLLHGRQSRWHAPAYALACVVLIAVFEVRRSTVWSVVLALSGAALFYTNYFVAICFLVAIAIASPLLERNRAFFIRLGTGLAGAALLSLPGVIFYQVLGKAGGGGTSAWLQFWTYVVQFFTFLAPLPLVVIGVWLAFGGGQTVAIANEWRRPTLFLFGLSLATCLMLAFAPWTMFRYLSILFPVAGLLIGLAFAWLVRRKEMVGWAIVVSYVLTSVLHRFPLGYMELSGSRQVDGATLPIVSYLGEIASPPRDPDCALADYLRAHALPGDTVLTTYGDLVLQFYTRMHIVGGMEGQPLPAEPEWIVGRSFILSAEPGKDLSVVRFVDQQIDLKRYELATTLPDEVLVGNPDPAFHAFGERPDARPLRVMRRK